MKRINGYIDLCSLIGIEDCNYLDDPKSFDKLSKDIIKSDSAVITKYDCGKNLNFYFFYNGIKYYFKYDLIGNPYNELIVNEICKKLGIACVSYDLACLGNILGVISKDFKKSGCKYISGYEIIKNCYQKDVEGSNKEESVLYYIHRNSLEGIWHALEYRYKNHPKRAEIVKNIMNDIVKMFIVDILVGQVDRHLNNWYIVEDELGNAFLQPLFDDNRMLLKDPVMSSGLMSVENSNNLGFSNYYEEEIEDFLRDSSIEFIALLKEYLKVLEDSSIDEIIKNIEIKTGHAIPGEQKAEIRISLRDQHSYISEVIEDFKFNSKRG